MAVDPYAICPCGSGKKLKFCCPDLVGDIEKIQRMIDGDQPRAALQHVERTLAKHTGRPSLLDLKSKLELMLGEVESAEKTIAEFINNDPNNPSAFAQQAIVLATNQDASTGAQALQKALTLVEQSMPRRVLEAIGAIGQAFLMEGNIVAARAHLWLYQGIAGQEDTRALSLLVRLNQAAGLPLLLRDHLYMRPVPADHPGAPDHDRAQVFASRGMWQPASQVLESLCVLYPELPSLAYNRALVCGWLGDRQAFAEGMHNFAAAYPCEADPITHDEAVEAEALAQLVDPDFNEPPIDVVKLTYAIQDEDALAEQFSSDKRIVAHEVDPTEYAPEDGPPPRAAYLLLDKRLPETGEGIARDAVPSVVSMLSQYGRQTDREERIELVLDKNEQFDAHTALFKQTAGAALGELLSEERIGESNAPEQSLSWRWHFPPDTPPRLRRELLAAQRHDVIVNDWPKTPRIGLGGKSPAEAAGDQSLAIALAAAVLLLEQGGGNQKQAAAFTELRQSLGLPVPPPIDPAGIEIEQLPIGRVPRIDPAKLGDEQLVGLYQRATLVGARGAVSLLAREIVSRPSVAGQIDVDDVYARLITEEDDNDEALRLLDAARQRSEAAGESSAQWDLLELELHIVEGAPEEANRVLTHLRQEHLEEPGVAEQLYQIMYALGATPEAVAASAGATSPAQPAGADSGSAIWTPGDDTGAGGQKLWTPD